MFVIVQQRRMPTLRILATRNIKIAARWGEQLGEEVFHASIFRIAEWLGLPNHAIGEIVDAEVAGMAAYRKQHPKLRRERCTAKVVSGMIETHACICGERAMFSRYSRSSGKLEVWRAKHSACCFGELPHFPTRTNNRIELLELK